MGAKGSVEAAKMNADNWGHLEVCSSHRQMLQNDVHLCVQYFLLLIPPPSLHPMNTFLCVFLHLFL